MNFFLDVFGITRILVWDVVSCNGFCISLRAVIWFDGI